MSNKKKSGYDQIKGMLNRVRSLQEATHSSKRTLNEQHEQTNGEQTNGEQSSGEQYDDVEVINDVEVKILSTDKEDIAIKDDEKTAITQLIDNFRQQISQIADLEPGLTINDGQIRLDGVLTDLDIKFVFIAGEEAGTYLNASMLKVDAEVSAMVAKLQKFEEVFKDAVEPLIRNRQAT
jgi:hypothetical protein